MKKGKIVIMIIAIVIVFVTAILMATAYDDKKKTEVSGPDKVVMDNLVYRVEKEKPEDGVTIREHFEEALNEANYITVEKVIRTTIEDNDGSSRTVYDTYLVSDVDFIKEIDDTEDFAVAVSGTEYDENLISTVEFKDAFGFDYRNLTAKEVYEKLLFMEGFDCELANVSFDKETNEITGQNLFILNEDINVISKLFPEYESKDVIEKKAFFQTVEKNGVVIPDYFAAVIRYREGEQVIEKSIYLQVSINEWEVA